MSSNQTPNANISIGVVTHPHNHPILLGITPILSAIELLPIGALWIAALLNCWLLVHCQFLHRNLRVILLAQSISMLVYICCRLFLITYQMANQHLFPVDWPWQLMLSQITFGNSIGHVLIIERTLASIYARSYERWKGPWFSIAWISIMLTALLMDIAMPSFNHAMFLTDYQEGISIGSTVIVTHITLLLSILEIIFFFGLNMYNKSQFNQINHILRQHSQQYCLAQRYQLVENLKCHRQLAPSFLFHLVNILCSNAICLMVNYKLVSQREIADFAAALIYLIHALAKLCIEVTVITFHPKLKANMYELFRHLLKYTGCLRPFVTRIGADGIAMEMAENRQNGGGRAATNEHLLSTSMDTQNHFKLLEVYWNEQI